MKTSMTIPLKLQRIIDRLVEEGEYQTRTAFVYEAILSHLRTWYPSRLEKEVEQ